MLSNKNVIVMVSLSFDEKYQLIFVKTNSNCLLAFSTFLDRKGSIEFKIRNRIKCKVRNKVTNIDPSILGTIPQQMCFWINAFDGLDDWCNLDNIPLRETLTMYIDEFKFITESCSSVVVVSKGNV